MDEHGLLDVPCNALWYPVYYGEAVWTDWMPCSVAMWVNGGWDPEMLLYPVP